MLLGEMIVQYRNEHGLSQRQFAAKCGLSNSYIAMIEKNKNPTTGEPIVPTLNALKKISSGLGLGLDDLLRSMDESTTISIADDLLPDNMTRISSLDYVPLLGEIACGVPMFAEQNIDGYLPVSPGISCNFMLLCKGDSMAPRFLDGDYVLIRQQEDVNDGQIAAVFIDGSATLKRIRHIPGGLMLIPENEMYETKIITGVSAEDLRILGLAVGYQRALK